MDRMYRFLAWGNRKFWCGILGVVLCGCQAAKDAAYSTAGMATGGAVAGGIGYAASKGNPLVTAGSTLAGAAAGGVITGLMQGAGKKGRQESFYKGYDLGKSDAAKQQYWIARNLQKSTEPESPYRLTYYELPINPDPEAEINRVPYSVTLPVYE